MKDTRKWRSYPDITALETPTIYNGGRSYTPLVVNKRRYPEQNESSTPSSIQSLDDFRTGRSSDFPYISSLHNMNSMEFLSDASSSATNNDIHKDAAPVISKLRSIDSSENEKHSSLIPENHHGIDHNLGPFNTIELVSILVIILLIISLFIYHCHKASKNIETNLNQSKYNHEDRRRFSKTMRRRHSLSRSSSFASNLASVREEPEIFDTRLADSRFTDSRIQDKENTSPTDFQLEPWYKWLQHDSPKNSAQQPDETHKSENNSSYLITVTTRNKRKNKCDDDSEMPRSLSF